MRISRPTQRQRGNCTQHHDTTGRPRTLVFESMTRNNALKNNIALTPLQNGDGTPPRLSPTARTPINDSPSKAILPTPLSRCKSQHTLYKRLPDANSKIQKGFTIIITVIIIVVIIYLYFIYSFIQSNFSYWLIYFVVYHYL